jgi:hypothetical protein
MNYFEGGLMMDFYIDIGAAVLLRVLSESDRAPKYRRLFLKLFRAIVRAFEHDEEFRQVAGVMQR